MRVHLLSDRGTTQNSWAFLAPLLRCRNELAALGVSLRLFERLDEAASDCDVLAVNSKALTEPWRQDSAGVLDRLEQARGRCGAIVYFERASSAGVVQPDIIDRVDRYLKTALYLDRAHYARPVYCARLFAEHYHRTAGVQDSPENFSVPLGEDQIAKLGVAWNTGLANYSRIGPRLARFYGRLPLSIFAAGPRSFRDPEGPRTIDVSCRINTRYSFASVAHQRVEMARRLAHLLQTDRVGKLAYMRELEQASLVLSPFGYSEINYKDFEVFLTGGALIKPDMAHLETWPDYFQADETYFAHDWDLEDLEPLIEALLQDRERRLAVAARGQSIYRHHAASRAGREELAARFKQLCQVP